MCKHTLKFTPEQIEHFNKGNEVGGDDGRRIGGIETIRKLIQANVLIYPEDAGYGACKKVAIPKDATDNQIQAAIDAAQAEVR